MIATLYRLEHLDLDLNCPCSHQQYLLDCSEAIGGREAIEAETKRGLLTARRSCYHRCCRHGESVLIYLNMLSIRM